MYYLIKLLITAALIVLISEVGKRSTFLGGLLASLPIVSFFALIWMYVDGGGVQRVADQSQTIFWLVLPSLPFFVLLPVMLRQGVNFYLSLGASTAVMFTLYLGMVVLLKRVGVTL